MTRMNTRPRAFARSAAVSALAAIGLAEGLAITPVPAQYQPQHTPRTSGDPTPPGQHAGMDRGTKFINDVAQSNMFEIETAKIALERSRNEQIRSFAQKMLSDHQTMAMDMMAVAGGHATVQLERKPAAKLDQLRTEIGPSLDKTYMEMQVEGHREALGLYQDYAKNGDNAQLKAVAADVVPHVQQHLREAQAIQRQ